MPWYDGPAAARAPRDGAHRQRPQPDRPPLPGAVRAAPEPRLPRLRRHDRLGRRPPRRRDRWCCPSRQDEHASRASTPTTASSTRRSRRMAVTRHARRRDRREPRRHARPPGATCRASARSLRGHGGVDARAPARAAARLPAQAHHQGRLGRGAARIHERVDVQHARAPPGRARSGSTTSAASRSPRARPLLFDAYAENRATGAFILIDALTNATVGAGILVPGGGHCASLPTQADRLACRCPEPGQQIDHPRR